MRTLGAVLFFLAFAASGQEAPEAVNGKFHRAIAAGDLDEMVRYAPEARRAEMQGMSAAQKDAAVKMMQMMLPRAFTLLDKRVAPDGKTARLVVSGQAQSLLGGRPETTYGRVAMVTEKGEWKVDEVSWSNERPSGAGAGPAAPAQTRPAEPPRTFGAAKQECVFKPVMTDEDRERCK
jgi:hypothetical protein